MTIAEVLELVRSATITNASDLPGLNVAYMMGIAKTRVKSVSRTDASKSRVMNVAGWMRIAQDLAKSVTLTDASKLPMKNVASEIQIVPGILVRSAGITNVSGNRILAANGVIVPIRNTVTDVNAKK
jgi:hypothetical protein